MSIIDMSTMPPESYAVALVVVQLGTSADEKTAPGRVKPLYRKAIIYLHSGACACILKCATNLDSDPPSFGPGNIQFEATSRETSQG